MAAECNRPATKPIEFIDVTGTPFMAVPSQDGCFIFVSLSGPRDTAGIAVLRRNGGSVTVSRVAPLRGGPTGLALTHDGRTLAVANGEGLALVDVPRLLSGNGDPVLAYIQNASDIAATGAAQNRGPGSVQVAITKDGKLAFTADEWTQSITVIDLGTRARIGRIPTGLLPIALVFSPDEKFLYTTTQMAPESDHWPIECKPEGNSGRTDLVNPQGAVLVIDVQKARTHPAGAVVAKTPAGCSAVRLAISPGGRRAYVTARNSNAMLVFDTQKLVSNPAGALIGRVQVGTAPVGIAVIDRGRKVVVTNSNRFAGSTGDKQSLTVIDAKSRSVIGSIGAGAFPREIRLTNDGRTMFVTNFGSKTVEMIDLARLPLDSDRDLGSVK